MVISVQQEKVETINASDILFDDELKKEERDFQPEIITIFGEKGVGKNSLAYGIRGNKYVLCFDEKATRPKDNYHLYVKGAPKDYTEKTVRIFNPYKDVKKLMKEENDLTELERSFPLANFKAYLKTDFALDKIAERGDADWIMFDAAEILKKMCEQVMRYKEGLLPYQGFPNRSLWHKRNLYALKLHQKALSIAKMGVIYTVYIERVEAEDLTDGQIKIKQFPKWVQHVKEETDVVLYAYKKHDEKTNTYRWMCMVTSSKINDKYEDGWDLDVTNKTLTKAIQNKREGK